MQQSVGDEDKVELIDRSKRSVLEEGIFGLSSFLSLDEECLRWRNSENSWRLG